MSAYYNTRKKGFQLLLATFMTNKEQNKYSIRLSEAITWIRFPLIFFIILLHCYSTVRIPGNHVLYFKVIYPFSLWLGETGVPGFFFISGFLFFLSKKYYLQKLKIRFHTLLIPYILWNTLLLGFYILAYYAGYPQDINGKNIENYTYIDFIRAFWDRGSYDEGNFVPILCPFWYIRNLLIMSVLSPLLYYIIKYSRELFLMVVAIWWLMTPHNAFISQTILFFCLGAYFSILDKNPLEIFIKYRKPLLVLCVTAAFADIMVHTIYVTLVNLQIHRIALILNIPALFILADFCCQRNITSKLLPNATFIVFSVHYPIVVVMRKACASQLGDASDIIHIPLYFVCVIVATTISIISYVWLDKYLPKVKNILSGNR